MGTQNLNNYNFNRIDAKLNYSSYYDFFLVSDEKDFNTEVVWSNNIIGLGDTTVLPVLIDLNDSASSSKPITTCLTQYPVLSATPQTSEPFTILSKFSWLNAKTVCDCSGITVDKKCNLIIAETARSNGLYNDVNISNVQLTPPSDCVEIYKQIPIASTFNKLHFDKRFKMSQVKGYGLPLAGTPYFTDTSIMNASDSSGYYQELKGGFYQGFYKLHGYDYEVLPTRPNKGWSFSSYLKLNTIVDTLVSTGNQVENCYNASGYNGVSSTTLCSNTPPNSMGNTLPPHLMNYSWKNASSVLNGVTNNSGFFFFKGLREGQTTDVYSNVLGFRITDDMRIGYRTLRYTGDCVDTGGECTPNSQWTCGWGLEESYSEPICPFISKSGNCANTWIQVDVVFDRNIYLEDCDLLNMGGINDLMMTNSTSSNNLPYTYSPEDPCDTFIPGKLNLYCSANTIYHWFTDKDFRMGTLKFYVNGRVVHTVNDYEEIIPRHTNQTPESQFGVSYNMSWGGGAWGYRENKKPVLQANDLISQFFAGSFIGGISQMMYYIKPLTADEIYHNFLINKERYSLIDCEECKNCPGGCRDCDLPTTWWYPPTEEQNCYLHMWSYCSSVQWNETEGQSSGGTLEQIFSGATEIVFLDDTLPGYNEFEPCNTNNSSLFWDSVGQPTVGTSLGGLYLTKISNPDLWGSWACFTYLGVTSTTSTNIVNMTSSSGGYYSNSSGGTLPWNNSGDFAWVGPWDELSVGTAFENCCLCTEYLGPGCNAICPGGCMAYTAVNYAGTIGEDGVETWPYCDCSGVNYNNGGYDISCCVFDPPCVPGCTDITASNYNGAATCDCWGIMGGGSNHCCEYTSSCYSGCTDMMASNYNNEATCDCNGVVGGPDYECCTYTPTACVSGCTDHTAENYNSSATCDCNGLIGGTNYSCCLYVIYGCMDPFACNYNPLATHQGDFVCYTVSGCTNPTAINYNPSANCDDGSCVGLSGCTDPSSFGFNPIATSDCSNVLGGNDYSCCLSSCDMCATNNINGLYNIAQLNTSPYGWTGGDYDNTFINYQENDNVIYNGCCYLCGVMNSGGYFECSDFVTYGAPDTNTAWLSCCPNACDSSC